MTTKEIILVIVASVAVLFFAALLLRKNKKENFELTETEYDPDEDPDGWEWDEKY